MTGRRIITTEQGGLTRLHLRRDVSGRARLAVDQGMVAARVTGVSGDRVSCSLLSTVATLLGGDRITLDIRVADGLALDLSDVAALVAYHGRGRSASFEARVSVGEGSTLRWHSQPLVVCDGADVWRGLTAELAAGAGLLLDETVVLGRHGERGGILASEVAVTGQGRPLLVERLGFDGSADPGEQRFLRRGRTIRTRSAFGRCAGELVAGPDEVLFELAGGGRVVRSFGEAAGSVG